MKKLFLSAIFLLMLCAPAWATSISVSSFQPGLAWNYGATPAITLRVYTSASFVTSDGVSIAYSPVGGTGFYKTITCSLSGTTLTVNSFVLPSTTDATPTTARYTFIFFQGSTKRDTLWSNYQVPVSLGTTITNSQLEIYNRTAPAPPRPGFPTTDQVQQLINAVQPCANGSDVAKGCSKLSVAPVSATTPIALGNNDPRVTADQAANVASIRTLGTGAQQAAPGNTPALKASNLSDLVSTSSARTNLGLGNSATKNVGTTSSTVASGNLPYGLTVFNVVNYGADNTGVADSLAAFNAAIAACNAAGRGLIYAPGAFKISATMTTITCEGGLFGDGMLGAGPGAGTRINFTSTSTNAFNLASANLSVESLALIQTTGTPTAGYGFNVTGATVYQKVDFHDVTIYGFYHAIHQAGAYWRINHCALTGVSAGSLLNIENSINPDAGDWIIDGGTLFQGDGANPSVAINILSSGGGKIIGNKILNGVVDAIKASNANTSILIIANNSIELFTHNAIVVVGDYSTSQWANIIISGNQIAAAVANTTNNAIDLVGVRRATITANVGVRGGSGLAFIVLETHCANVRLDNNDFGDWGRLVQTDGTYTGAPLASQAASALSISSNTITPEYQVFHLGAGLLKTFGNTSTTETFIYTVIPDAAFTYDATGNIVVPSGGGTAVIGRPMQFVCYRNGSCYPSY